MIDLRAHRFYEFRLEWVARGLSVKKNDDGTQERTLMECRQSKTFRVITRREDVAIDWAIREVRHKCPYKIMGTPEVVGEVKSCNLDVMLVDYEFFGDLTETMAEGWKAVVDPPSTTPTPEPEAATKKEPA